MSSLFFEGLGLLVFGMGTVFVFLVALILATHLMSIVINKVSPEPAIDHQASATTAVDPTLLKVLAAAIKKHRSNR